MQREPLAERLLAYMFNADADTHPAIFRATQLSVALALPSAEVTALLEELDMAGAVRFTRGIGADDVVVLIGLPPRG